MYVCRAHACVFMRVWVPGSVNGFDPSQNGPIKGEKNHSAVPSCAEQAS